MSIPGKRDFRPALHFTPASGWINDPNGMVYIDGVYHLFAQYYQEPFWGPMHWYHATSTDLVNWDHLPIALYPDEIGHIWSGSAVYDRDNTSGFGTAENPPIVAMYTQHEVTGDNIDQAIEHQSIAYSLDGVNFTKYEGNPVLKSNLRDFRDPKLIENPKGGWTVVIAKGDRVVFYGSKDLKVWEQTGEFGPEGNLSSGVWECPDLFPIKVGDKEKWVLLVSMGGDVLTMNGNMENHGWRTQYFIGEFDGERFTCDTPFDRAEFIDASFDNYAGVTFHNTETPILIAWGTSWTYAKNTPTGIYSGTMTMARKLSLIETEKGGLRLASEPVLGDAFGEEKETDTLPGEVFLLKAKGTGTASITLKNEAGEAFLFGVNESGEVYIDRSAAGARDFDENFASDWFSKMSTRRFYDGAWELSLIFDRSITELFADNGTIAFTQLLFPDSPYTHIETNGDVKVTVAAAR